MKMMIHAGTSTQDEILDYLRQQAEKEHWPTLKEIWHNCSVSYIATRRNVNALRARKLIDMWFIDGRHYYTISQV